MSVKRMEKLQPQFISSIYFHFTQKSKQAFYPGLALKHLPKKIHPIKLNKNWPQMFFLIFYFFRYLKAFYINYNNSNSITEHITLK